MKLTKKSIENTYNVTLDKAKMRRTADNKIMTGWVARANGDCDFGEKRR